MAGLGMQGADEDNEWDNWNMTPGAPPPHPTAQPDVNALADAPVPNLQTNRVLPPPYPGPNVPTTGTTAAATLIYPSLDNVSNRERQSWGTKSDDEVFCRSVAEGIRSQVQRRRQLEQEIRKLQRLERNQRRSGKGKKGKLTPTDEDDVIVSGSVPGTDSESGWVDDVEGDNDGETPRPLKKCAPKQLPVRTVPNPHALAPAAPVVDGGPNVPPPAMIQLWLPWKPHELMSILTSAPNKNTCPQRFIEFLSRTIRVYQADSRDLWSLVQQVLTGSEWTRFKEALGYQTHDALEVAHANNENRETMILDAVHVVLRKPVDITKVLDMKPKKGETVEEFLERFKEVYGTQSGDQVFSKGQPSPQFCSMLMNCLPGTVATAIRPNNLDWCDTTTQAMSRAVKAFWKDGPTVELKDSLLTKVKTEYVVKPDHDCLHSVLEDTSPRSDLSDTPLLNPDLVMFTDGSSSINKEGTRISGYAVVSQEGTTLESGAFQVPLSAQQTELFALTRACILGEDLRVNLH
uniref:uncharacterized protein n=1 Tax=Pristiophorus japonicus TaxID=55135 RepID=UPI00398F8C65